MIKTLGSAKSDAELKVLVKQAELFIKKKKILIPLLNNAEDTLIDAFVASITNKYLASSKGF